MTHRILPAGASRRRRTAPGVLAAAPALLLGAALMLADPGHAHACACGCGMFEVGTPSMFPARSGGMLSLEYDFMDQRRNWSGGSSAPADANDDQRIRTSFVTLRGRYQFSSRWGVAVDVPYWERLFDTSGDAGEVASFTHAALGDVRVMGTYTGFSPDLSTGVSAGLKLPTGDHRYANFDRDTEIGTGSTDLLLGGYHLGGFGPQHAWTWYLDGRWTQPFAYAGDYRPGAEGDLTAALAATGHRLGDVTLAPMLGLIGSTRARDAGSEADPGDSGYTRLLIAPGLDARLAGARLTLSVDVPLAQHVNGDQLVAPAMLKLVVGHRF